jgi:hypothetical protein
MRLHLRHRSSSKLHIRLPISILAIHLSKKLLFISAHVSGILKAAFRLDTCRSLDTRWPPIRFFPSLRPSDLAPSTAGPHGLFFPLFARISAPLRISRKRIRLAIILHDRFLWPEFGFMFICYYRHRVRHWVGMVSLGARTAKFGSRRSVSLTKVSHSNVFLGSGWSHPALQVSGFVPLSALRLFPCLRITSRLVWRSPLHS